MENKELLQKLLDKAIELYFVAEEDRRLFGESYFEFTERGMRIVSPEDLIIRVDATGKQIRTFKKELKKATKNGK